MTAKNNIKLKAFKINVSGITHSQDFNLEALIEKISIDYATISPEDKYALLIDVFER